MELLTVVNCNFYRAISCNFHRYMVQIPMVYGADTDGILTGYLVILTWVQDFF